MLTHYGIINNNSLVTPFLCWRHWIITNLMQTIVITVDNLWQMQFTDVTRSLHFSKQWTIKMNDILFKDQITYFIEKFR